MLIKLLVAALIFLSVMFIGLIWLVCVLAKITLWLPGGITAFFAMCILGVFIAQRLKAHKAAKSLEDALRSQAKQQALLTRPDLQLEVQKLHEEFDKAVDALQSSRLGKSGRDALYYLPWYTIIGPPGAGKSTALRNSGLRFPYLADSGAASVKGLGGTRNCDWWLTNQAVVLDTAGRWATQEEDHDEWLAFLGLLKKHRPRKPLNGLITAISVGDIVNAREEEVESLARRMRERIDEVIGQLDVALPVYVLFTKCDLVEGFVEMFGDLRRADRDQVWGFTAPLTARMDDAGQYFDARFSELAGALDTRALGRMSEERSVPRRQRIYAFPQQFLMMRRNLARFLSVLFGRNVYRETPAMRGVYFTSGTQEGRPFSLLLNRIAEAMGVKDRVADTAPAVDQKSYFLHDVFMNVIFEDRDVASASEAELRRQKTRRIIATSVLTVIALAFSLVPGYAWQENTRQLSQTSALLDHWEGKALAEVPPLSAVGARLKELGAVTANLSSYAADTPKWLTTLGMYQGAQVHPLLRRYYANLLRRELVRPVIAHDVQELTDFGFRYEALPNARPTAEEQSESYTLLKLHLLLSAPKSPAEPPFDEAAQAWVAEQLAQRWSAASSDKSPASLTALKTAASGYARFMTEYPELAFTRDKDVVVRARAALARAPFAERALERIVATVASDGYDLDLDRLVGRTGAVQSRERIRGAFTRRGWENRVRDMLGAGVLEHAGELWVLGLADGDATSQRQLAKQLAELSSVYFHAYVNEWNTFLGGLRIETPTDNEQALTLLRDLTRGQPPLISLLMQKVSYNVQLKPKEQPKDLTEQAKEGALGAIKNTIGAVLGEEKAAALAKAVADPSATADIEDYLDAPGVAKQFEGFTGFAVPPDTGDDGPRPAVPYDSYQEQLVYIRDALQMQQENPDERDQLMTQLQQARVRARALVDEQPAQFRPVFEALLWPPVEGASQTSTTAMAGAISTRWCNEVVTPFEQMIRGRYPFDPAGHDLALDELARFYQPDTGALWKFIKEALTTTVELDGDQYRFAKKLGDSASSVYSGKLIEFLAQSRDITSAFYPRGSAAPQVDFEVRIHPSPYVATTTMSVGGKQIEYHNGPEKWQPMSWPGQKPEGGAMFLVRGANGMNERISQDNVWGLFRLIEAGTVTRSSSETFSVAWQLQTHDVTLRVDFRPVRGESPFFGVPGRVQKPNFLQPVRAPDVPAPKSIVLKAAPCRS